MVTIENKLLNSCLIGFSVLEIVGIIVKLNSDLDLICHLHYFVYLLWHGESNQYWCLAVWTICHNFDYSEYFEQYDGNLSGIQPAQIYIHSTYESKNHNLFTGWIIRIT